MGHRFRERAASLLHLGTGLINRSWRLRAGSAYSRGRAVRLQRGKGCVGATPRGTHKCHVLSWPTSAREDASVKAHRKIRSCCSGMALEPHGLNGFLCTQEAVQLCLSLCVSHCPPLFPSLELGCSLHSRAVGNQTPAPSTNKDSYSGDLWLPCLKMRPGCPVPPTSKQGGRDTWITSITGTNTCCSLPA